MKSLITFLMTTAVLFSNEDISFENDFLQSLEEVSEIATKTKLNIDDTPSFVTVLHHEKLSNLGINTVFEAIGLVPGVQLKREKSGIPVIVFRGVSQKGEVKLMLDGVSINNTYRGSIYHYLDFPIDLIERIEVIRGAGSVLYGSGAMSGVINIITKTSTTSNSNLVFTSTDSENSQRAGTLLTTQIEDIHLAFDAYYYDTEKTLESTDRHLNDYSLGLNIKNEDFGLLARIKNSNQGNAYGVLGVNDTKTNQYDNSNDSMFIQLSYKKRLYKDTTIDLVTGINEYKQNIQAAHPRSTIDTISTNYKERSKYAQVDLVTNSVENHQLLVGARYETANVLHSEWKADLTNVSPTPEADLSRTISSIYAVSNYTALSSLNISAGIRYDNYSDFGSSVSPTLGVVYRASEKIKLKALYSHAYRAPSWVELTSNSNLKAETSKAIETGIIYKHNNKNTLRVNFYSFKIHDMIIKETTYVQNTYNKFNGAELEYIFSPTNNLEINLFASIIDTEDENEKNLIDIADKIASLSLLYKTSIGLNLGSYIRYISTSPRSATDIRNEVSSSMIYDQTFSYDLQSLKTSLVIKDLFNKGTYYALPQSKGIDFTDFGRSFIVKAIWEF